MIAFKSTVFLWLFALLACGNNFKKNPVQTDPITTYLLDFEPDPVIPAANRTKAYLPLLKGKKIGVVANPTSVIYRDTGKPPEGRPEYTHLIDSLLALGVDVIKIFTPEHGLRGTADAGEHVKDGKDTSTGLPVYSLYGSQRKPTPVQLQDLDMVVFDIQDVGVRFYTFIASLQLVMEACAESHVPVMVLDRPNPNGHYVDGPTMKKENMGFLGLTPIPLVYGMTIGEYGNMINKEGWLSKGVKADLVVIPLENYTHARSYSLPIRPSPNLPNDQAINLYPSLGLFEGTTINAGRGTEFQFQRYGAPYLDSLAYTFSYVPQPNFGAKNPKHKGKRCYGADLSGFPKMNHVSLEWLMDAYEHCTDKSLFFNTEGFARHAGTRELQVQIEEHWTEDAIRAAWQEDLEQFRKIRAKYLLYQ